MGERHNCTCCRSACKNTDPHDHWVTAAVSPNLARLLAGWLRWLCRQHTSRARISSNSWRYKINKCILMMLTTTKIMNLQYRKKIPKLKKYPKNYTLHLKYHNNSGHDQPTFSATVASPPPWAPLEPLDGWHQHGDRWPARVHPSRAS